MFEFVNRVGTLLAYILIESLKASSEKFNDDNTKAAITKSIIDNAIDLNGIFRDFCNLFEKQNLRKYQRHLGTYTLPVKSWRDIGQIFAIIK